MTLELEVQTPTIPRDRRIRELFSDHGGEMSTVDFAQVCIDEGVWSEWELKRMVLRNAQEEIRRALRTKDQGGLPFAGPTTTRTDDGAPVWRMRQGWLFEDYSQNIREHIAQRDEAHAVALKLATECAARYGTAIEVPDVGV